MNLYLIHFYPSIPAPFPHQHFPFWIDFNQVRRLWDLKGISLSGKGRLECNRTYKVPHGHPCNYHWAESDTGCGEIAAPHSKGFVQSSASSSFLSLQMFHVYAKMRQKSSEVQRTGSIYFCLPLSDPVAAVRYRNKGLKDVVS